MAERQSTSVFESRAARRRFVAAAALLVLAVAGLWLFVREYLPILTDSGALRRFVEEWGVFAPVVFVAVQAIQVVVAPIPGQVTAFASGYLFGSVLGTVYSMVGVTIGSAIAFWLSRRYGRPFVASVVRDDLLARFDGFVDEAGTVSLFLIFLVPGLPDDVLCFVGGLTDIDLWKLVTISFLGRLPAYVLVNVSGSGLAEENVRLTAVTLLVLFAGSVWGILNRDRLLSWVAE
ncbi:hypothetical protein BV210_05980 [Halorientalis sp. IM1011]|uniref:TVP38/TMEM64 family protein n=1 Tax=Halorientalis sp. IM1011 TaxID=1932360 RepID=UPI00097CC9B5|nr:VTT domain-containing protein [Halorientalis sp. IM1011]AQL42289.1 hypothetical protein BV210_05980 [Halorientalis sp. IM1011]